VYTPHGGSLVYSPGTFRGAFYRKLEWLLQWRTDLFLFESAYVADLFRAEIGRPRAMVRIVRNGVGDTEFASVAVRGDATDFVCVGELRPVKGIDVLIEALAILNRSGRRVSATIAGEGPQGPELVAQAQRLGVAGQIRFVGYQPAREAFAMGRMLVLPSRAESLPLEAAAAGVPIIATRVGGIPEIFGPQAEHLIAPDDVGALVGAIGAAIDGPGQLNRAAQLVKSRIHRVFSSTTMVDGGIAAYREALAMRKLRAVHITNF
jgi:glycosyltransferase involved in cell wall biosynthesis